MKCIGTIGRDKTQEIQGGIKYVGNIGRDKTYWKHREY
jgi:hypothetical protein